MDKAKDKRRTDWVTAIRVDAGIAMSERWGVLRAAQFMSRCNVPYSVARRVLVLKKRRPSKDNSK